MGWMCPQAWQGYGTCMDGAGTADPLLAPLLNHHLPTADKSKGLDYGPTRPGEIRVCSCSLAGFGQPFGSQPDFQPAAVTQRIGFPAWLTPFQALPPGHAGLCHELPSPPLQPEQCGIGHLPMDHGTPLLFAPRVAPTYTAYAGAEQSPIPCARAGCWGSIVQPLLLSLRLLNELSVLQESCFPLIQHLLILHKPESRHKYWSAPTLALVS